MRAERAERLVGADIGGRLLPPDVLFARLKGENKSLPARCVRCAGHDAARHLADERFCRGHESEVRPAEGERNAERLALAGRDVEPLLTGRLEQSQRDGVHRLDRENPERVRLLHDVGVVVDARRKSSGSAGSRPRSGRRALAYAVPVALAVRHRGLDELDREIGGIGIDHLPVDRVDAAVQHHLAAAGGMDRHLTGFAEGGTAVVERGVRDIEPGQTADLALVFIDRLQGALGGLRLVRRIGGIKLAPRREGVNRSGNEMVVEPAAEKTSQVEIIPSRKFFKIVMDLEFRFPSGKENERGRRCSGMSSKSSSVEESPQTFSMPARSFTVVGI